MSAALPTPFLPLAFFAAGVLALGLAAVALALDALAPLALLHLVAVGSFATIAMGALYQFVPVAGMRSLRAAPLGFVHLGLAVAGTVLLISGFARDAFDVVAAGGALHLAGVSLQAVVLALTLRGDPPAATARGAAFALLGLVVTAALGVTIALGIVRGDGRVSGLIGVHGVLGVAGFFGTLIVAVTFRLLRMFERFNIEPRAAWLEAATALAAVIAAIAPRVGVPLLAVAALLFAYHLGVVGRWRNPAYQRETFLYAMASALAGCAAAVAAVLGATERALVLALWLFVGTAVVGYLQRIVPFIWWIRRSRFEGTRNIPTLGEMNETRLGHAVLVLWVTGGLWCSVAPLARAAGWLGLFAWLGLVVQIVRPFTLRGTVRPT